METSKRKTTEVKRVNEPSSFIAVMCLVYGIVLVMICLGIGRYSHNPINYFTPQQAIVGITGVSLVLIGIFLGYVTSFVVSNITQERREVAELRQLIEEKKEE